MNFNVRTLEEDTGNKEVTFQSEQESLWKELTHWLKQHNRS